jgi:hypothetical protein
MSKWGGWERRDMVAAWPGSLVREEEGRAEWWGPHDSDQRGTRYHGRNAQTQKEGAFW